MKGIESMCTLIKKKYINNDNDFVLIIVGGEGSGKSNCGFCFCSGMDSDFGVKNIVFTRKQHDTSSDELKPGSALQTDEGANVVCKMETNKPTQIHTIKKITMTRYYRHFRVYCISDITQLHNYFVRHRLQEDGIAIIRIKKRGKFIWYSRKSGAITVIRKKLLSKSQEFSWSDVRGRGVIGNFSNYEGEHPGFSKDYRQKKRESIEEMEENTNEGKRKTWTQKELVIALVKCKVPMRIMCRKLGLKYGTIRQYKVEAKAEGLLEDEVSS